MKKTRILIVDDNAQVRQDLKTVLAMLDEVEVAGEAAGGLEAIEQAASSHPDVVLIDLEMPGLDGWEAIRHIKSQRLSDRVIVLTIHDHTDARIRATQAGADAYMVKGASLKNMLECILNIQNDSEEQS